MLKQLHSKKGFTLIELLIVVAIIAILAAIAIPQFSKYRARGYAGTLNSDAKNAYTAAMALVADGIALTGNDCADLVAAGYVQSSVAECSKSVVDQSQWTITIQPTGVATGMVTSATINQSGNLTVSKVN